MDVRCGSSAARVRHAPTRDREPRRCPGPDDHPEPRPRGRTRRTAGPAHPCADPSSIHPADVRLTPTESRLVPTLKLLLQQNRPNCENLKVSRTSPVIPYLPTCARTFNF